MKLAIPSITRPSRSFRARIVRSVFCTTTLFASLFAGGTASGQVSFTGADYEQDFNGLNTTGTQTPALVGKGPHPFSALDSSFSITGMDGWFLANPGGSSTSTEYRAQDGSSSGSGGRGVVSFGTSGSGERALGALPTGDQISTFGVVLTNNSGVTIDTLHVSYTGEQWRRGNRTDEPNTLTFAYGKSASIDGVEVTGANANLNFASPVTSGPAEVALNGNLPANQGFRAGALTGLDWQPGQTLALRWGIDETSGQDDGLAIDNLLVSLTGLPSIAVEVQPSSFLESAANPAAVGTVTRSEVTGDPLVVTLDSNKTEKATVPATVVIPGDEASATFEVTAIDNDVLDFDQTVVISATSSGFLPSEATITVRDDETVSEGPLRFEFLSSIQLEGAEIAAFDPASERTFVSAATGLQVLDFSSPGNPAVIDLVVFTQAPFNLTATDVTSVTTYGGVVAVAVPNAVKQNKGHVVFLDAATLAHLGTAEVGVLPDNVTFTPDGTKVLTADEGEMLPDGTDPAPGTVSIIDVSGGFAAPPVATADFTSFDSQAAALLAAGVRIFEDPFNPGTLKQPSLDFEPEYVAVSPDGTKAMVTLQEANAVALLDIATATFTDVVPLGEKDFSGLFADFSDRDGVGGTTAINLTTGNPVFGLYMPDAIASFEAAGQTYYVMANEGDDRDDFLPVEETIRLGNSGYTLDPAVFPNAATLKQPENLGRLIVSNSPGLRGDIDDDGNIERILTYGARSISILDAQGTRVYDSGDILETFIASLGAPWFDDTRSDNKGPEPEGVTIGVIDGRSYAFVAVERSRGVIVFDVTDPVNTTMAGFVSLPGDRNPEDVTFIPASDSPTGVPLIVVTNENSNTLTTFAVRPENFTLQLLHFADGEAGLLASQTAPNLAALVDAFDGTYDNTLILSGGDNFIPGAFLNAGTDPALKAVSSVLRTNFARPDIAIHNLIGVEASAIGNHEWDLGSAVFMDAIRPDAAWVGAQFPYISSNLDYSGDSAANGRFTNVLIDGTTTAVPEASTLKSRLVPTAVITKGGERIGLVGATTQILRAISSPSGTFAKGFPVGTTGADDMELLATHLQPYIDELTAEGVDKIVLLSHLQQLSNEQLLATKLSGVDIILAAGSNTRLFDADDVPAAFPGHGTTSGGTYPIVTAGTDGKPTLIVNTDNEFTYLGRLVVDFDENGEIILANLPGRVPVNGAYASTAANVAAAWGTTEGNLATTAFAAGTKGALVKEVGDAVQGVINAKDGDVKGFTSVYLEGERNFVRSEETNLGSLTADANAAAFRAALNDGVPVVSLKNGGGIRAQIGSIAVGSGAKLPPAANPGTGKAEGGISQLDIENAMRFNNRLMVLDTTPQGLKNILEHGVAEGVLQGRFPQVGGVSFAWDPARAAGDRITTISLVGENEQLLFALYDGTFSPWAPPVIRLVTLNFLAGNSASPDGLGAGGDSYPIRANGENFRFLLADGTLSAPVDRTLNFTATPALPANPLGEQQAFADYLAVRHATLGAAYGRAETTAAQDLRIQNLSLRSNEVPLDLTLTLGGNGTVGLVEEIAAGERQGFRFSLGARRLVSITGTGAPGLNAEILDLAGNVVGSFAGAGELSIGGLLNAGDYLLRVGNPGATAQILSLAVDASVVPTVRPDVAVGARLGSLRGVGAFGLPATQRVTLVSRRLLPVQAVATVANRGTLPDAMRVRGTRGSGLFKTVYTSGGRNVTAAMQRGRFTTATLSAGGPATVIKATISPDKKRLTAKGKGKGRATSILERSFIAQIRATSAAQPGVSDAGRIEVRTR